MTRALSLLPLDEKRSYKIFNTIFNGADFEWYTQGSQLHLKNSEIF